LDFKTNKIVYSDRWAEILGYLPEEVEETTDFWGRAAHPEDRVTVMAEVEAHIRGAKPYFQAVYRARAKTGQWKWIMTSGKVVKRGPNSEPLRMVGTSLDLTERIQLHEQLVQAQKMESVGRLAGGVAHDFNNLLTVVSGHTSFLMDKMDPESPYYPHLEKVSKASERAAELTRRLLAFSRQRIMPSTVIDLNDVVSEANDMLKPLIGEDIDLCLEVSDSLGLIKADEGQIMQIIINLAINSRDAMPHGGRLEIKTRNVNLSGEKLSPTQEISAGDYVELSIADTGNGIEPDILPHIFEPFFSTKDKDHGTGLGLSIVYGIVSQSGGYITCKSKPGEGTRFLIFFPKVSEGPKSARVEIEERSEARGTETILLVEDEEGVRELVKDILTMGGYRVRDTSSPAVAIQMLSEDPDGIDLVLSDVVMPGLNGREMVNRMLKFKPKMKYLFVSGYTDRDVHKHGPMPADLFLQKPFSASDLRRKIRGVLDQPPESNSKNFE
jgi:PAS domain S-box-containing protein